MMETMVESQVIELLAVKIFLLVLDNVWTENYFQWEQLEKVLRHGDVGSRVLIINITVKAMGTLDPYRLGFLDHYDDWGL